MARREFNPPVQRRSEETLERLLSAAKDGLARKGFDALTLDELTREAGVTVGAFYQRFPSKAALLHYLEDEAYAEIREAGAVLFLEPPAGDRPTIRERLRAYVTAMAETYRAHRGVMRELVQRSRSDPDRQRRRMDMTRDMVARAVDWLLLDDGEIDHPDPRSALGIALLFTTSALRDVILFEETWTAPSAGPRIDALVEELIRAMEAYLGLAADR
ncbi:MAG: helix-turn-helix domain-containing protein [Gemmatimonadota bacterium]|jgi:AcrR family transcriptional regulator